MTEPQLPFDPPLPASHPLASPPRTPPAAPPRQPGLPDKTAKLGTPLTLYGVPCRLLESRSRITGQNEFIVWIENNDDSLLPEIRKKLRDVNIAANSTAPKYAASAAKAIAAAERKLEKCLLPPKPPKPAKPPVAPLQFADKIGDQTRPTVKAIVEAGDPRLTEEWYIDVVKSLFECTLADQRRKEVEQAKRAKEREERERGERELREDLGEPTPAPGQPGQPSQASPAAPEEKLPADQGASMAASKARAKKLMAEERARHDARNKNLQ